MHELRLEYLLSPGDKNVPFDVFFSANHVSAIVLGCVKDRGELTRRKAKLLVKTNRRRLPSDKFIITPNSGIAWGDPIYADGPQPRTRANGNPITTDVARIFVSCVGSAKATFFLAVRLGTWADVPSLEDYMEPEPAQPVTTAELIKMIGPVRGRRNQVRFNSEGGFRVEPSDN